jgi:zinc transport system ATP-binding protein
LTRAAAITVEAVSYDYGDVPVLEGVDLRVAAGEFLGLVGPNGGGKSTLLKLILGLLTPKAGRITVLGESPAEGRRRVGYVSQFSAFSRDFPISVEHTVLMGRLGKTQALGGYRATDRRVAHRAMAQARVLEFRDRRLATLSGGQLQRVMIARALACEPEILVLDEPTANIDLRGEQDIFDLLGQLDDQPTILVVSHDIGFISQYVTRVACLNRTLVCHGTDTINGEIINKLYGSAVRMIHHKH